MNLAGNAVVDSLQLVAQLLLHFMARHRESHLTKTELRDLWLSRPAHDRRVVRSLKDTR